VNIANTAIPDESESLMINTELAQDKTELEESDVDEELYYKLATPACPAELDWTITLSRNDFPWHEVKFGAFSAKDCYDKYSAVVKDPFIFLKKVLGNKEKYKKMMQN
jgi:hypothetical protein